MKIENETNRSTSLEELGRTYTVKMTGHELIRVIALSYEAEGGRRFPASDSLRFCGEWSPIAKLFPDWRQLMDRLRGGFVGEEEGA